MNQTEPQPTAMRRRRWMIAAVAIAVAAATAGGWVAYRRLTQHAPADFAVDILLAQDLPDPAGNPVSFGRYRGRVLVVNFWAPWCPPCVEEMPELSMIATDYAARGVDVVGIGVDFPDKIAQFAAKRPVSYQLVVARNIGYELSRQFGNRSIGLPYTVVIDRYGAVVERILGRFDDYELRSYIDTALDR